MPSPEQANGIPTEAGAREVFLVVAIVAVLFLVGHVARTSDLYTALTGSRLGCLPILAIGCLIYEFTMREARRSDKARTEQR